MVSRRLVVVAVAAAFAVTPLAVTGSSAATGVHTAPQRGVSIMADTRQAEVGDRVRFSGTVDPAATGDRIRLQVRKQGSDHGWRGVRTTRLSEGAYEVTHRMRKAGVFRYRVVMLPADSTTPWAVSGRAIKVSVYRLVALTSLTPVSSAGFAVGTVRMSGYDRPGSLVTSGDGVHTADYRLGGDCTSFSAYVGVADVSPPGGALESTSITAEPGRVGGPFSSNPEIWTLHRAQTLRLTMTTSGGAVAAFGSPMVSCRF